MSKHTRPLSKRQPDARPMFDRSRKDVAGLVEIAGQHSARSGTQTEVCREGLAEVN